jgi:hypothetical protein
MAVDGVFSIAGRRVDGLSTRGASTSCMAVPQADGSPPMSVFWKSLVRPSGRYVHLIVMNIGKRSLRSDVQAGQHEGYNGGHSHPNC